MLVLFLIQRKQVNTLTKYIVTLTIPIRFKRERFEPNAKLEVDAKQLEELKKHNAVKDIKELDVTSKGEDAANNADANGDNYLTVDEIKAALDAREIDYKGVRKRDDLLALLEKQEEGE